MLEYLIHYSRITVFAFFKMVTDVLDLVWSSEAYWFLLFFHSLGFMRTIVTTVFSWAGTSWTLSVWSLILVLFGRHLEAS